MDYKNKIKEALMTYQDKLEKRQEILEYLARIQHYEERWAVAEFGHELQNKLSGADVYLECKRHDICIWETPEADEIGKRLAPDCIIEVKTVKNYDIGYWIKPILNDIEKLASADLNRWSTSSHSKVCEKYLVIFSLSAIGPKTEQWYQRKKPPAADVDLRIIKAIPGIESIEPLIFPVTEGFTELIHKSYFMKICAKK